MTTQKVDILEKLLSVFTVEQLAVFADMLVRVQERARERRSDHSVTVCFDASGFPRHFNGSDNVIAVKPTAKVN